MKKILHICLLAALAAVACSKAPTQEVPQHELTPIEQQKQHLADSYAPFIQALDVPNLGNPKDFIMEHSSLELGLDGKPVYRLEKDMLILLKMIFSIKEGGVAFDAYFYGGPFMSGVVKPTLSIEWEDWENNWDIDVYDGKEAVAKLGVELLGGNPEPVFRFPDGTSYAVTSVVFTESLIEYLIENGLPTE